MRQDGTAEAAKSYAVHSADQPTAALDEPVAAPAAPAAQGPGELVLGRYRLVRRLGAGGFGVVWQADDERLARAVAVKRIATGDEAVAARAQREARAAARLAHPGIVALFEAGRDEGAVYLVSELVRGRTLRALLDEGALSDRDVVLIGLALCDALAHAHGRGVVHRDVKPGNVIVPEVAPDGAAVAKLTDFGVAHVAGDDLLTRTGDVVGTLAYMAPEQAEGREAGAAADLYGLALVLYEALAGFNPVRGRGAGSTARRLGTPLPPLGRARRDLPAELCAALDRALTAAPEQRGALADLRRALDAARGRVADEPGLLEPPRWAADRDRGAARSPPDRRRARARLAAGALAGALAAASLAAPGVAAPLQPAAVGGAVALAVAVLPRAGWLAVGGLLAAWLVVAGSASVALLVAAAALPTAALLRGAGALWSVPALAPALGLAGLAGAWPALAGQPARAWHRATLGALGAWWLLVAEAVLGERLLPGDLPAAPAATLDGVLAAATAHPVPGLAAVWAGFAACLPWLVRGRSAARDAAAAAGWAAALAAVTVAVAGAGRGVVAAAALAGVLAVGARVARGDARGGRPS